MISNGLKQGNRNSKYKYIVFVTGLIHPGQGNITNKGMLLSSADVLQRNILDGMIENGISNIKIINSAFYGTYPKHCNKLFFKESCSKYNDVYDVEDVSFINLPIVNEHSRAKSIVKRLKRLSENDNVLVIFYSLLLRNIIAMEEYKKINANAKYCFIITDLPENMNLAQNNDLLHRIVHSIGHHTYNVYSRPLKEYKDYCIYLTEKMKPYALPQSKSIVVEGMIKEASVLEVDIDLVKPYHIVYTGGLSRTLGIYYLLDAFSKIKRKDIVLDIAGDGVDKEYVISCASRDIRIRYHGTLDRQQVSQLQKTAYILVCPTLNNGVHSDFAFPAKLIEYLASGNYVVSNKLSGIPDEYYSFLHCPSQENSDGLAEIIEQLLAKEERNPAKFKQIQWVKNNKTTKTQTKRIIDFIS